MNILKFVILIKKFKMKNKKTKACMRRQLKQVQQNNLIKQTDKILIIAPHPDDEVISCGGIIAKYSNQIDVLCVNSSGVRYDGDILTAEETAQIRCDEFYNTMKLAGVNKSWIAKIWGIPPMFDGINSNFENYLNHFNFKDYDIIFCPHKLDGHREHRFVGNNLVKKLLKKSGYKKSLKIARYEVWGTIAEPDYFEEITDVVEVKKELINAYESRKNACYAERITSLNYYRGILSSFNNKNSYSEAFQIQSVDEYLREKDDKSWSKPW